MTRTLKNAIAAGKVAHAYLSTGPRGVGKTIFARLIARAVNCTKAKGGEPCNRCPNCVATRDSASPTSSRLTPHPIAVWTRSAT